MDDTQKQIYEFLLKNPLGAVATASKSGEPSVSTVFIFAKPDFTFNFLTRTLTQKERDIVENPIVALEAVDASTFETVQIHGPVQRVTGPDEITDLVNLFRSSYAVGEHGAQERGEKHPDILRWVPPVAQLTKGDYVLFKITPTWARYRRYDTDYNKDTGFTEAEYRAK